MIEGSILGLLHVNLEEVFVKLDFRVVLDCSGVGVLCKLVKLFYGSENTVVEQILNILVDIHCCKIADTVQVSGCVCQLPVVVQHSLCHLLLKRNVDVLESALCSNLKCHF